VLTGNIVNIAVNIVNIAVNIVNIAVAVSALLSCVILCVGADQDVQ